jgi:glycosyltransferase involved in cell wall biosynthesis
MQTILLSNIPHYHYLAAALHRAGLLKRYITSKALVEGECAPGYLPAFWRRKLEGRRVPDVPAALVRQIVFPEFLQKTLPATKLVSFERACRVNNDAFDRMARRFVDQCDVFHFVSSIGLLSARRAKKNGSIVICDVRQEHPRFQREILQEEGRRWGITTEVFGRSLEPKILAEYTISDYIVVPSRHAQRTFIQNGWSADQLPVIPYGVDLKHFQPGARDRSVFRILFAGIVTLRKGVQYLLEAFKSLRLPGSELVLAGPMDPAVKPVLAKYEGLFRYIPALPKLGLCDLYAGSSVFVLPSLADSFSLATLEAMACGTPVIVSENTGAADWVQEGINGFVTPIRDVQALAERIEQLYSNRERLETMGSAGRQTALEMTWHRYGKEAVDFYRRLGAVGCANRAVEEMFL